MSDKYIVESILRPPIEYYTTLMCFISAYACFMTPEVFLISRSQGYLSASLFIVWGVWQLRAGNRIVRYIRNLRRMPRFTVTSKQVPINTKYQYLGKGFEWTEKHTQRLHDIRDTDAVHYVKNNRFQSWAEKKRILWEQKFLLSYISKMLYLDTPLNPVRPLPAVGGHSYLHGVGIEDEHDVYAPLSERVGHTLYLGSTRTGKSRVLEINLIQDINRKDSDGDPTNVVIVFDPKGDAGVLKRTYLEARRAGRLGEFFVFHLGYPELSCRYNAVGSFMRITEVASRVANGLPGEGNAAAFREFTWQFVNVISVALSALGKIPSYKTIRRYMRDIDPLFIDYASHYLETNGHSDWKTHISNIKEIKVDQSMRGRNELALQLRHYINEHEIFDPALEGLMFAFQYERSYFEKLTVAVGPFLEKLTTGKIAELLSPDYNNLDDNRTILDWGQVIRQKGIVYVGLDALTDPEVSSAVGESIFSDMTSYAGRIYKEGIYSGLYKTEKLKTPKITVHADEFSDLIGQKFSTLANKCGGAGIELVLYCQTISDINAKLNNESKSGQLIGNINNVNLLRVKELATAKLLLDMLPECNINQITAISGVMDTAKEGHLDFQSNNQDRITVTRVPLLTPSDITGLPKGQLFAMVNGSQLFKVRIPLASDKDDDDLPNDLRGMINEMQERYQPTQNWHHFKDTVDASTFFRGA